MTVIGSVGCQELDGRDDADRQARDEAERCSRRARRRASSTRPSRPPLLRLAKKRIVGCSMPTQIVGLVAEPPDGIVSDVLPGPAT